MIYVSPEDQTLITKKMQKLPPFLRSAKVPLAFFEFFGAFVLCYGACVSVDKHPLDRHIPNPCYPFLLACFYYFALSISAPFSGGHLNPAVTMGLNSMKPNRNKALYMVSQLIGALAGASLAYVFFAICPTPYTEIPSVGSLFLDMASQAFCTFLFTFFYLYVTQTDYMAGEYFQYFVLSLLYFASCTFTLRKGVVNPVLGFAFQTFAAYHHGDIALLAIGLPALVVAPMIGAIAAPLFFKKFYQPLKEELEGMKEE